MEKSIYVNPKKIKSVKAYTPFSKEYEFNAT